MVVRLLNVILILEVVEGGLYLAWNDDFEVKIKETSEHHIDSWIMEKGLQKGWRLTGIYGWPDEVDKHFTWELLRSLQDHSGELWCCIGDCNEILGSYEKQGGRLKEFWKMRDFREAP